ncbi:3-demethylubiquinone-9 3-O-methyltransferase [Desertifilum sp. FACHB-1129]|uniref:3-demethylubiquinone-9 3-O-methyltransferase n=2 Tax=Desertifilum tharense IPPAS B-1220 TaxID=1781255 RepID=A0A1E5QQA1_9CYAN|nr:MULTISPECIES: bifunctional 2-polyprenyl-6-hydroxyphenol methylase/3-demethylubiquinol 3-O-methyltransferase UbiG [Desertifilum]MDA0209149.1 bifunctional 2-polyprenyl-6-hydroxyphenol methylase/3-demethylubiquinol 3-O-methyltransferase UbiG [Cyanobacteria bacterium FC1]MBD2311803.1 3-demethylubiquinone-9 3-O-methyltransferase [Desertifilum sp. FACHB-1129]MBD2322947.1 3-demethylubiquinone-9 3-O-methyltransferase [Desertifilum sp. FACHB-866]MBD2333378.1 3-demethylubiquinone-9 3-O-methyltransfera
MTKNDLEFYNVQADRWWDANEKIYALYHLNRPRFEFFDRYIENWQGLTALDVGCGGGFSCEYMAKRGVKVSGIDLSEKCIQAARNHANLNQLEIDYRQGVAEKMPYNNDTFDAVICVDVLEHVADVSQVLAEIHRILKPNGIFFFDTINRNFKSKVVMIWMLENILREIQPGVHDWEKFITPEELTQMLESQGFNQVEIQGFDMFGSWEVSNPVAFLKEKLDIYREYRETRIVPIKINSNTSVMYIGKAVKSGELP